MKTIHEGPRRTTKLLGVAACAVLMAVSVRAQSLNASALGADSRITISGSYPI